MKSEWSHLPNAVHIDKILASLKSHPRDWKRAYNTSCGTFDAAESAFDCALDILTGTTNDSIRDAVLNAIQHSDHVNDVITALIAYDESGYMLDLSVDEVHALMSTGHPYAILILPAVIAFQHIANLPAA